MKKLLYVLLATSMSLQANAKGFSLLEHDNEFQSYYYVGAGLSFSFLNPEKEGVVAFRVDDDNDLGFRLHAGYRKSNLWSAEALYMDLGSARIGTVIPGSTVGGDIDYTVLAAHGNYFFGQDILERDVNTFVKLGLSSIRASNNVPLLTVDKENSVNIMTGLGLTTSWRQDWDLRFDLDFFSRDAAALSIGLQYKVLPKQQQKQVQEPRDSDGDGVMDADDQCPGTEPEAVIDQFGCELKTKLVEKALEVIDLKTINFEVNSDKLVEASLEALDQAAQVLLENPEVRVEISAHTDSDGNEGYNQRLSQRRADSVRNYLINQGVAETMLTAIGYGESQPLMDNSTPEGKAANRRVELKVNVEEPIEETMDVEEANEIPEEASSNSVDGDELSDGQLSLD